MGWIQSFMEKISGVISRKTPDTLTQQELQYAKYDTHESTPPSEKEIFFSPDEIHFDEAEAPKKKSTQKNKTSKKKSPIKKKKSEESDFDF